MKQKQRIVGIKEILGKRFTKERYSEHKAKVLLIRYKERNSLKARNDLVELCYPIIFTIIKKQAKKITLRDNIIDNEDLFNECIITTIKSIDGYRIKNNANARFITYLYVALERAVLRFVNENFLKYNKMQTDIQKFVSMGDVFDDEELGKLKSSRDEIFYEHSDLIDLEKDFSKKLDKLQLKIYILKLKNIKLYNICKVLKISQSHYYFQMNEIKQKLEEYLYEKEIHKKLSKRKYNKRIR